MQKLKISVRRLTSQEYLPRFSYDGDAAFDLPTAIDAELSPGRRRKLPTGLAFAIPAGYAGLVLPRSGLAQRLGIGVVNSPGLIDSGYRGEVSVILVNLSGSNVSFKRGDRIAQLMVVAVPAVSLEVVDRLSESERGEAGFGSSGW
jgi:dUTP pyrophosphatase